jgi:hypothetical protein
VSKTNTTAKTLLRQLARSEDRLVARWARRLLRGTAAKREAVRM